MPSKKISTNERKQFQEMELLLRIAKQVAVIDTLDELLTTIVDISAKETNADRGTQSLVLQVLTDGWPNKDPIQQGEVTFSLRRYDANGRPDEENGDWKVDVIEAL